MADAVTPDQVYEAVVDEVAAALEASSVALWIVREDGRSLSLARAVGYATEQEHRFASVAVDNPDRFPAIDIVRNQQPIWIDSQMELEHYPELAAVVTSGRTYRIGLSATVIAQGGRSERWRSLSIPERRLDGEQRGFLQLIARYSAQALERLRLQLDNQQARERAELLYRLAAAVIGADSVEQVFEGGARRDRHALGAERSAILAFDRRRRDAVQGAGAACPTSTARRRGPLAVAARRAITAAGHRRRTSRTMTCWRRTGRCSSARGSRALGFIPLVAAAG